MRSSAWTEQSFEERSLLRIARACVRGRMGKESMEKAPRSGGKQRGEEGERGKVEEDRREREGRGKESENE
jgi:hypothetical protein